MWRHWIWKYGSVHTCISVSMTTDMVSLQKQFIVRRWELSEFKRDMTMCAKWGDLCNSVETLINPGRIRCISSRAVQLTLVSIGYGSRRPPKGVPVNTTTMTTILDIHLRMELIELGRTANVCRSSIATVALLSSKLVMVS